MKSFEDLLWSTNTKDNQKGGLPTSLNSQVHKEKALLDHTL